MKYKEILAAIVTATIWTACGGDGSETAVNFETVKVEKQVSITREEGAPQCSVNLQLAAVKGEPAERAKAINATIARELLGIEGVSLQQAADSFASKYTNDYQHNFAPLYREDRHDPEKRAWYEYHYNVSSETSSGRKGITVYKAIVDYYEGGAHGINQKLVMNFSNKNGHLLTLSDVFVPGFEQRLNELLLTKLYEKTDTKDTDELREKGYLYSMEMFAPENFILGEDEITFVFNPYEIAPYSEGLIELKLEYDEIEDIIKE